MSDLIAVSPSELNADRFEHMPGDMTMLLRHLKRVERERDELRMQVDNLHDEIRDLQWECESNHVEKAKSD